MEIEHGGNLTYLASVSGLPAENILDFSANINPLGLPEWFRSVVSAALGSVVNYPDPACTKLVAAIADRYAAEPGEVVVGNGSTEILHLIPRALGLGRAVIPVPCYSDYLSSAAHAGMQIETIVLEEREGFALDFDKLDAKLQGNELVYLCNPSNPTGVLHDAKALRRVASRKPSTLFLVDEAFGDFVEGMESLTAGRPENVIVLLSLTKVYAIPGLRLGCAVADPSVVRKIRQVQPPWSVNTIAQAVGEAALRDIDYVDRSRRLVREQRLSLGAELNSISGLTVYPGTANFLLIKIDRKGFDAGLLAQRLLQDGIAIRVCDNFQGLDKRFFRVAVRTSEENQRLCDSLKKALGSSHKVRQVRKTPALMFQGTSSNAGKSVLTAALGRILLQDGYRVAPFKSQNMSLNSFVTRTGGEMGALR